MKRLPDIFEVAYRNLLGITPMSGVVALVVAVALTLAGPAVAQNTYVNPVIPGDHPDPTLTRIGDDYYTSGSSFNVMPKIYHSTDLVHWEVISQPVAADWDLYGDQPAGGVWGGHTVLHDGLYWHFFGRGTGDRAMYYVTSNRPKGPWSSPVRMRGASGVPGYGVDNSIFIDDDNRWFLLAKNGRSGNYIVELGPDGQPEGEVYDLTWLNPESEGYPYSWAEGPVMWKHGGYYYYSFAQHLAGTQYVMRSDTLSDDPDDWEEPRDLFESVRDENQRPFRAPNHSSPAVTTANGTSWIISQSYDLSGPGAEWQALGRQGVLSEIVYEDGWPMARFPSDDAVEAPDLPSSGIPWTVPRSDMFDASTMAPDWSFLGYTPDDTYSMTERPGWLRLKPSGGGLTSAGQNTVIQNAAEHAYALVTRVDFAPDDETDEAGLWTFNGPETLQAKLFVTADAAGDRAVTFSFDETAYTTSFSGEEPVWLCLQRDGHDLTGSYSLDGATWTVVGDAIDASRMDREQPESESGYNFNAFTGNQQGPYVMGDTPAYFDVYIYRDAYSPIPAEYPSNFIGVASIDGSGSDSGYLGGIDGSEWAMYAGVAFGGAADGGDAADYPWMPQTFEVVASSASDGGTIEVLLDSLDGRKIAEVEITSTGEWNSYKTFTAEVEPVTGQHDVFLRFVGSPFNQLFRIESFTFTAQPVETSLDEPADGAVFDLAQNYPNPFSGATQISYELSQSAPVKLVVYDVLGRKVATLVDGVKAAGSHTVAFDSGGLASGVYAYRFSASDHSVVKRMMLIR